MNSYCLQRISGSRRLLFGVLAVMLFPSSVYGALASTSPTETDRIPLFGVLEAGSWTLVKPDGTPISDAKYRRVASTYDEQNNRDYTRYFCETDDGTVVLVDAAGESSPFKIPEGYELAASTGIHWIILKEVGLGNQWPKGQQELVVDFRTGESLNGDWDFVSRYSEGLFVIVKDEKYGYADATGGIVIAPQYRIATAFKEGLAVAIDANSNHVILDRTDKSIRQLIISADSFRFLQPFRHGLSQVLLEGDPGVAFVDATGRRVGPVFADSGWFSSDGLAHAQDARTSRWGYIGTDAMWVIAPQFRRASSFHDGRACVLVGNARWQWIDKSGDVLSELSAPDDVRWHASAIGISDSTQSLYSADGTVLWKASDEQELWQVDLKLRF